MGETGPTPAQRTQPAGMRDESAVRLLDNRSLQLCTRIRGRVHLGGWRPLGRNG
jgi:hypothetical protein